MTSHVSYEGSVDRSVDFVEHLGSLGIHLGEAGTTFAGSALNLGVPGALATVFLKG